MPRFKVVATDGGYRTYRAEEEELARVDARLVVAPEGRTQEALKALCRDADGLLVRQGRMDADFVATLDRCKVLARYGVGYDNVDVAACTARGIQVCNVTDYCLEDVATHAIALLLSAVRSVPSHDRLVRQGRWNLAQDDPFHRIAGRTLGLLGLGAIGRQVVKMLAGFGLEVVAYDPYLPPERARELGIRLVGLDDLFRQADYLSLHAPLTPETRHAVNARTLGLMKPGAILVNTSRGGLVDDAALVDALRARRIRCAALDVFNHEPVPADSPYRDLDNVILSDHAGWYSEESLAELQRKAAAECARVLAGTPPRSPVNRVDSGSMAPRGGPGSP